LLRAVERVGRSRDLAVVRLLLNTGLRVQELCALTWKDVALSERKGLLTVRHGKGAKHRQVPLNHDARAALATLGYPQHAGQEAAIIQGQRGPMTPRGVQSLLARYEPLAGLEDLSPHALRHTFCKNLIDAGVGLEQVAALAGHESLETTRRYCTPSRLDLERAVERIGERE
jgi:site-specific recombinase XerD